MKNKDRRWVIVSPHGLYVGQWMRRADAIAQHCFDLHGDLHRDYPGLSRFAHGGLTAVQSKAWADCKRRGDRCVRAVISWPA